MRPRFISIPTFSHFFEWLKSRLDGKVDKVTGKGLSTEDYTTAAKSKVDAIPASPKYTDTITTINGKTGAITKADITALGIPAQDTVVDISGKADKTYVDNAVQSVADPVILMSETAFAGITPDPGKIYIVYGE